MVGGVLSFVLSDAMLATKLLLFGLHLAGAWLFWAVLRRLGIGPLAAMVAACGFAGSFAHLHLFLFRGAVPQAFTLVFLPMVMWGADGLLRGLGRRWLSVLAFSMGTAGLIVNHQPHALFTGAYLALFGLVLLLLGVWRWRNVPLMVVAGGLGCVAGTLAVVPVLAESSWVMIEPDGGLFRLGVPGTGRLLQLVTWANVRTTWGIDYWAYLGAGLLGLGSVGIVLAASGRVTGLKRRVVAAALPCLVLGLFLYNPVVRDVMFLLYFLGLMAAVGLDGLIAGRVLEGRWLLAVVALVMIDLASTSVQPVARTDKGFLTAAGQRLEAMEPDRRVVQVGIDRAGRMEADLGPDGGPTSYVATIQRVAGNHNMAATGVHNYLITAVHMAEDDLVRDGALSPATVALLRQFNVGRVVCASPTANGCPASFRDTEDDPVLGRFIPVPGTPAVFSPRLAVLTLPAALEKPMLWPFDFLPTSSERARIQAVEGALRQFLQVGQLSANRVVAASIPVRGGEARPADEAATWPPQVAPQIKAYRVELDRVRLEVRLDAPGFVQLAHPWFPSTVVRVNGTVVSPLRGTIDLMVLPLSSGTSVITLEEGTTTVRQMSLVASGTGLAAVLVAAVMIGVLDRRRGADGTI